MNQERIEKLKNVLNASEATAWEIIDTTETGWEFYLIGSQLDQHRVRDVNHIRLRVYTKGTEENTLGTAEGEVSPTADIAEMAENVNALVEASRYVVNPAWTLNKPIQEGLIPSTRPDIKKISADFLHSLQHLQQTETAYINSSEVFVTSVTKRVLNSEGLDVTDTYPSSMAEVIVNARDQKHEIELYRMFQSGSCDTANFESILLKTMKYGQDRLIAQETPAVGNIDLVLSTDDAIEVYYWYIAHLNTSYKYRGYSDWSVGTAITSDTEGDAVTIMTRTTLPNSSRNCRFDDEGALTKDITILKDNVPQSFFGPRQFSQYLDIKDSFNARNFEVLGGSADTASLLQGDYLEVVEFSSFQVDEVSGDIAGEIRLGYLHRGNQTMIVSGGSVSGNMSDMTGSIRFSKETAQYNNYLIPSVTRLRNISVAGAERETH